MIKAAIVGYGNIGRYALKALEQAEDFECVGIVRRCADAEGFPELAKYRVVSDIDELGKVDVAILTTPSRKVEENAVKYLAKGISTVDSFDIHSGIADLRATLSPIAVKNGAVSVISAGWDPGSDSVVRTLLRAMAPTGTSYTNFGPGRSMGHTVAAKAVPGVKDALSMTIPEGKGVHSREVFIELEDGFDFNKVAEAIKSDPYFIHDKTEVKLVGSVEKINTSAHGVNLVRDGESSATPGQHFDFNMKINNPALTGQILVSAARAAQRQKPGCYTLIEIPPVDLLPGERESLVRELV